MMDELEGFDGLLLKAPTATAERNDPEVSHLVGEMLSRIEREGIDAVRHYSRTLDDWDPPSFEVSDRDLGRAGEEIGEPLQSSIDFAVEQVTGFARLQRKRLVDFEVETLPGVWLGQRQIPVGTVGAYAPAGRIPMMASPLMTVLVAKVAGVERAVVATPAAREGARHAPTLYAIDRAGADAVFAIGGVQALACMAFGIEGMGPVDMLVGPGNAYVAEAKRQLFGRVGIDLLAGPSEVAVIADETGTPELVAADLLAQAEHGPTSPAVLLTTSEALGRAVLAEIAVQLGAIEEADPGSVARSAWENHGAVVVVADPESAVRVSDALAPEHLEIQTADPAWYHDRLRNYGSLFLGARATVAFSDKAIGTNHVLPTRGGARYAGGLSVASFLKTLTFQRVDSDEGMHGVAAHVAEISKGDRMPAHEATATKRLPEGLAG